jgi:hypothetical protein
LGEKFPIAVAKGNSVSSPGLGRRIAFEANQLRSVLVSDLLCKAILSGPGPTGLDELTTAIQETFQMWFEILEEREREARKAPKIGTGGFFD